MGKGAVVKHSKSVKHVQNSEMPKKNFGNYGSFLNSSQNFAEDKIFLSYIMEYCIRNVQRTLCPFLIFFSLFVLEYNIYS